MLEALYEIGRIQDIENPLSEMTEDFGDNYKYLFKIIFNIRGSDCFYEKISVEEIDPYKKERYLYKRGAGANAPDVTPISKVTEPEKTFNKKIMKSITLFMSNVKEFTGEKEIYFLNSLDKELKKQKEQILSDLLVEFNRLSIRNDTAAVLSIAFIKDGEEKYLGDLEVFSKNLLKIGYKSNYFKFKTYSRAKDKICYMCKKMVSEVWGYAGTFQFYTVDKIGMVTGGFVQANAWKNYPICHECYRILERGKKYVRKRLTYRFCGFNYFLVPKLVFANEENLNQVLKKLRGYKTFTFEEKKSANIVETEERIFSYLQDEENYVNFDFLFFEEKQSGKVFNILLYLENITPTRLATIIKAKQEVDEDKDMKYRIFTNIPYTNKEGELDYYDIYFTFHSIRNFFPNPKNRENIDKLDFDKYFLDIIKNIFFLKPVSYGYLLNRFMEKIRSDYLNNKSVFYSTLSAFKILLFLDKLKILNRRRYEYMENTGRYEDFFSQYDEFFDQPSKKAIFLEGVLVQKLLNIQKSERNAQPFRSRLNGLKIDENIARRLLPEAINKLEEYDKNFYRQLEAEISKYFLSSDLSKFSSDELSFYFVMGMNLANNFEKKEKKEEENE